MKLIIAVIHPMKLDTVRAALNGLPVCILSVSQVVGLGPESSYTETYRGREIRLQRAKLRVEIASNDRLVDQAVEAVLRATSAVGSARSDDTQVYVVEMNQCVRLRNGEREVALAT